MRDQFRFRTGDAIAVMIIIACAGLLACLPFFKMSETRPTVQIYQNGTLIREVPIESDLSFTIEGKYENTVVISGGAVCVSHATCPGGDCVRSGEISRAGESIVCLPNRVEIRLSGEPELDAIVE